MIQKVEHTALEKYQNRTKPPQKWLQPNITSAESSLLPAGYAAPSAKTTMPFCIQRQNFIDKNQLISLKWSGFCLLWSFLMSAHT